MDGNIFNERIKKIDEVQSRRDSQSKSTPELKNILKLLTSLSHDLKNETEQKKSLVNSV